ncbi:hypothetical protein J1N35_027049 [Gossypium stocksii]|uniref:Uncharacterized protein n=1 Tax=Gossypium stocksii TaxID=47602 RepID=A0A9D3VAS4_9ROSI|nr:hypothetical protein J1N35_027049 [Gossypium stocksii]
MRVESLRSSPFEPQRFSLQRVSNRDRKVPFLRASPAIKHDGGAAIVGTIVPQVSVCGTSQYSSISPSTSVAASILPTLQNPLIKA